ncbi:hypothetical protein [Neptunomonas sp.]|uniref:hypothetical protein n=1 Tax=Neptunomonas sp. TaxID=1971898 RepID=UPI00356AD888
MQCRIVNRRGHRLHLYVCKRVDSSSEDVLCVRGWESAASHNLFGTGLTPKDLYYYPQSGSYIVDLGFNHGEMVPFDLPTDGGILYFRNSAMVGPWFLANKHDNPQQAVYRTEETRFVILSYPHSSNMVLGIDALLRKIESQLAGKIRPILDTAADADPEQNSGEQFLMFMASSLLNAAATATAALGPIGSLPSGVLMMGGSLMTGLSGEESLSQTNLQLDAFKARMQKLFDDTKSRDAATAIGSAENKVEYHRKHLTELCLRSTEFTEQERALYYDWAYESILPEQQKTMESLLRKISKKMQIFEPAEKEIAPYYEFAGGALNPNTDGNLYWALRHMLDEPDVRRFAFPEFILGAGLYAILSVANIRYQSQNGITATPATFHDVAEMMTSIKSAVHETVQDVTADMQKTIHDNYLKSVPERIEILRFFSSRLFDNPDVMRDPELTKEIKKAAPSFGVDYPQYWLMEGNVGVDEGPVLGNFLAKMNETIAALKVSAEALETAHNAT